MSREFRIEEWLVQPDLHQVAGPAGAVRLEPRSLGVLVRLAEHAGETLTRESLLSSVWSDVIVTEETLTHCVWQLRRALGDDAERPRFIQTIPRRGYRLLPPVHWLPSRTAGSPDRTYRIWVMGREVVLAEGENLLGRAPDATVWIDDEKVSRLHARIDLRAGQATLYDLESKNGTCLNGRRIESPTVLADRDEIRIGKARLVFRVCPAGATSTATNAREQSAGDEA